MGDFSGAKLLEFLTYCADKGLMNKHTVAGRKAAVSAFLGILEPQETADVTRLNLDEVGRRFMNLKGQEFTPESLRVYLSRARTSIDDFVRYRNDPSTFKPQVSAPRAPSTTKTDNDNGKPGVKLIDPLGQQMVFPVPIRPDVVVKIVGIPSDMTKREAAKIAAVVNALATLEETAS
jgi:hypothetical protein